MGSQRTVTPALPAPADGPRLRRAVQGAWRFDIWVGAQTRRLLWAAARRHVKWFCLRLDALLCLTGLSWVALSGVPRTC